jgi:hypothetical protein
MRRDLETEMVFDFLLALNLNQWWLAGSLTADFARKAAVTCVM